MHCIFNKCSLYFFVACHFEDICGIVTVITVSLSNFVRDGLIWMDSWIFFFCLLGRTKISFFFFVINVMESNTSTTSPNQTNPNSYSYSNQVSDSIDENLPFIDYSTFERFNALSNDIGIEIFKAYWKNTRTYVALKIGSCATVLPTAFSTGYAGVRASVSSICAGCVGACSPAVVEELAANDEARCTGTPALQMDGT